MNNIMHGYSECVIMTVISYGSAAVFGCRVHATVFFHKPSDSSTLRDWTDSIYSYTHKHTYLVTQQRLCTSCQKDNFYITFNAPCTFHCISCALLYLLALSVVTTVLSSVCLNVLHLNLYTFLHMYFMYSLISLVFFLCCIPALFLVLYLAPWSWRNIACFTMYCITLYG